MNIPGFASAQRAYENILPPEDADECEDGDCDECTECLAARAQDEADDYADQRWDDMREGL